MARDPEFLSPAEKPGANTRVFAESPEVALHTDPALIQGEEILALVATELAPRLAGARSAPEATDAIGRRITPLLAIERQQRLAATAVSTRRDTRTLP